MNRMLIGTVRRAIASWWHGIPVATARDTVPTIFLRILSILSNFFFVNCGFVDEKSFFIKTFRQFKEQR